MNKIKAVFTFGGPYLARYWQRLAAGILLGILFGMVNGSFVWATKTMFERLAPSNSSSTNDLAVATDALVLSTNAQALSADAQVLTTNSPALAKDALVLSSNALDLRTHAYAFYTNALSSSTKSAKGATNEEVWFPTLKAWTDSLKAEGKKVKRVVDQAIDPWLPRHLRALGWKQILGGLLLLPFLVGLRGIVGYLSTYCLAWVSERAVNDLRVDVLAKLNSLSLDFFHRSKTGDLLTQINGDTAALQRALSLGFSDLIKEPITMICILGALLALSVKLTLFAIILLPFCVYPIVVLGRKVRKASGQSRDANISQMSLLVEALAGIRVVKAYSLENEQMERFRHTGQQLVRHGMRGTQARGLVNPIIEIVAMTGIGSLLVYIVHSRTELSDLAAFLMGAIMLFEPVKKLAAVHVLLEQTSIGVSRLIHLLGEQPSIQEAVPPQRLKEFTQNIAFDRVSFSYGREEVLHEVSLVIPRGHKLGIAGESGSGKSTMINLMMRFYDPTGGAIRLDGVDLKQLAFDDLRRHMALVSQEIVLFDRTISENIACGRKGASPEEVEAAAKAAFAHDFISQLPQGYQTLVGERGQSLSAGQRQRISIARAFVRNAPILLLDEATASLDSHAEAEVQAAIERLEKNKTVICIAHRLSTLAEMDRVVVLTKGRIVEQGGYSELLGANGPFADMAARQGLRAK